MEPIYGDINDESKYLYGRRILKISKPSRMKNVSHSYIAIIKNELSSTLNNKSDNNCDK
jgi:hypothetical protein